MVSRATWDLFQIEHLVLPGTLTTEPDTTIIDLSFIYYIRYYSTQKLKAGWKANKMQK